MTVEFALFVSPEGIALAHRQPKGHWALVAEARLDGDDLDAAMAGLKSAAADRGGADAPVVLVLPDDQMLYTSFLAPANDADQVKARIEEGLDGVTPYAVADLVYDWRKVEEDRVKVAVVARETLGEATEFVAAHGFKTAGFAAMPPAERFPGMPLFGAESAGLGLDRSGMAFGGDDWVAPGPPAQDPDAAAPTAPEDGATAAAPDPTGPAEDAPPVTPVVAATEASVAVEKPDAPPPLGVDVKTDDPPPAQAPDAVEPVAQDTPDEDAAPVAITDPTMDQPIAPLPQDDTDTPHDTRTGTSDPVETAAPSVVDRAPDRMRDAATESGSGFGGDAPVAPDLPDDLPQMPTATRGKVAGPSTRPLTAAKPEQTPARRPDAATLSTADPLDDGADTNAAAIPALGFAARRGKAPKGATGDIVSNRPSRLGFGSQPETDSGPVLHPDAALSGPAAPARPGNRLAAQLARVRDASKIKPQPTVPPPASGRSVIDMGTEDPADTAQDIAARDSAPDADDASSGDVSFARRRKQEVAPPPTGAAASGENAFTSGLLARKPVEAAGPSFRMGLILTLVLLLLLALIAIWSALFLPNSPIARLFSGGSDRDAVQLVDDPPPPFAISAPPAMGELDLGSGAPDLDAPEPVIGTEPETETAALAIPDASTPIEPEAETVAEAPLPDIDAELDLAPLPPLPEEMLPSVEETERIYAEDGIWPRTPDRPILAALGSTNEIYVASIDPEVPVTDAIALSDPRLDPAELLSRVPPPPPFGVTPDRDARGLVQPTPEGVLTPEGAFVVLGRPAVDAIPRPREVEPAAEVLPQIDVEDAILGTFQPAQRPADLDETRQRQLLGGFSSSELAGLRPDPRPVSAQEAAAQASLFPQAAPADTAVAEPATAGVAPAPTVIEGTRLAVASSRVPAARPANISSIVAAAAETPSPAVAAESVARAPSIPSSADVTRAATERNAIRLRDVNLIGVTGTPNDRRALVRLPSGRFVRVGVGDRLDGGRVAAIGETTLQYVRNGRNVTLEIPG